MKLKRYSKKGANVRALTHVITVQEINREAGDYDGKTEEWKEFCKAWARIIPLRGIQLVEAQQFETKQLTAKATHTIRFRWEDGITAAMRVVLGIRIFEIVGVVNVNERNTCTELVVIEKL